MKYLLLIGFCMYTYSLHAQKTRRVDVCVYGGTSAGVMAAYTAKMKGHSVLLVEPGRHLGGLTSGGLGYTDIGNKYAITGLALDYYRRIGKHYGRFEQWIFEPHVAENLFKEYIDRAKIEVWYDHRLESVTKRDGRIQHIMLESAGLKAAKKIEAAMFIDCSYEGDLMAKAGVSYIVGREGNEVYSETYNGAQMRDKHQFLYEVDPYRVPGRPESGLVWGIGADTVVVQGKGDKRVQAYNFRICLTNRPSNRVTITRPNGYDSTKYELFLRYIAQSQPKSLGSFMKIDSMPNDKTDINNNGAFSTDMIGMNHDYPDADYETRRKIIAAHESYVKGFLYFIGHDPRMPAHLKEEMLRWGYPGDEYVDNGHWSHQLYVREARRMIGAYVMTEANCQGREVVKDGVGMAAYTMDSHNCQRLVVNGKVRNEGDVQVGGFGPYPISYRAIIPRESECVNLLVPVCLSASHIAYGSIRMEPVFMVLGQSAALAAHLAIKDHVGLHQIDVSRLQEMLRSDPLGDGSAPDIVVDNDDAKVEINGNWKREAGGAYGPSQLIAGSNGDSASYVRFYPAVVKDAVYEVYTYLPKVKNGSLKTEYTVYDGAGKKITSLATGQMNVVGQTSGEWLSLGQYRFKANSGSYIEISNIGANGAVVADAILLRIADNVKK